MGEAIKIHVGTSGFGYKEWKGKFYPEKINPKAMLRFYSERMDTVEINNTFYHMPTRAMLESWMDQVPDDFIFAIKAPQKITHVKQLRNVEDDTEYLFQTISLLGKRLGPILFQFPKSFRPDGALLSSFVELIPKKFPCAFEFRNSGWMDREYLDILANKKYSLCMNDTDEKPVADIISTAEWGYLRLRRSDYTDKDLARWFEKIHSQKWTEVFVYFEHEDKAKGPEYAIRFKAMAGD